MRKSDKKLDNELCKSLTSLCENELEQIEGFQWLTHTVTYPNVAATLRVVCVFDTNEQLDKFVSSNDKDKISKSVTNVLANLGIKLNNMNKQLIFDSEENCLACHNGNWAKRLK